MSGFYLYAQSNPSASARLKDIHDIAAVDMSLVMGSLHLTSALHRATLARDNGKMKTRSMESEIMYNLSCSSKIDDAVAEFTVKDESIAFAVIPLANQSEEDMTAALSCAVIDSGVWEEEVCLDAAKMERVRSVCKVPRDVPHTYESLLKYVLTRTACKNYV